MWLATIGDNSFGREEAHIFKVVGVLSIEVGGNRPRHLEKRVIHDVRMVF